MREILFCSLFPNKAISGRWFDDFDRALSRLGMAAMAWLVCAAAALFNRRWGLFPDLKKPEWPDQLKGVAWLMACAFMVAATSSRRIDAKS